MSDSALLHGSNDGPLNLVSESENKNLIAKAVRVSNVHTVSSQRTVTETFGQFHLSFAVFHKILSNSIL
jgi:hypothetical protein